MAGINSKEMTKNDAMELSRVQFQVGELVAHPMHGLCRIHKIEYADIGDGRKLYYTFFIGTSRVKATVFVPVAEASRLGARYPITKVQAQDILQILETAGDDPGLPQRACLEQISEALHAGDLFQLAELVRSACLKGDSLFGGDFEGSYSDSYRRGQALVSRAIQRLTSELAFVLGEPPGAIRKRIGKKRTKKVSQR